MDIFSCAKHGTISTYMKSLFERNMDIECASAILNEIYNDLKWEIPQTPEAKKEHPFGFLHKHSSVLPYFIDEAEVNYMMQLKNRLERAYETGDTSTIDALEPELERMYIDLEHKLIEAGAESEESDHHPSDDPEGDEDIEVISSEDDFIPGEGTLSYEGDLFSTEYISAPYDVDDLLSHAYLYTQEMNFDDRKAADHIYRTVRQHGYADELKPRKELSDKLILQLAGDAYADRMNTIQRFRNIR